MVLNKVVSIVTNAIKASSVVATAFGALQEDCNSTTTPAYWSSSEEYRHNLRHVGSSSTLDDHHYYHYENADLGSISTLISRSLSHGGTMEERVQDAIPAEHEADTYRNMWIGWSVIFAICGISSFCVWLAILLSKKASKSPFNYYLLYLLFPDWSSTLNCAVTCALNAAAGRYISKGMCLWQSWYITWGVSTNAWLNAVVMYEIHRMLRSSKIRKRYFPPTRRRVSWNALYVNLWTGFVATWGLVSFPWLPHETNVLGGLTCNPVQHDRKSTIFLWLAFMPCFILIPYIYAIYVALDVWRNKLLPPKGRRRFLAIYFFRIVCVFVVMWGPFLFCFFVLAETSKWVVWFGGFWGHLQTFMSAAVSTLKPDVAFALYQLLTCKFRDLRNETISAGFSESFAPSAEFSLGRRSSFGRGDEGRRRAERRTNAITDASFRRALEQFSNENSIREQTGPLGDSDNEIEPTEANDDEEAIHATAVTFGGNGTTPTSSDVERNSRTASHSSVDNVMRIESISEYDVESDQGDEDINDSSSPPPTGTPQSPRSPTVVFAEQLTDESSLPRRNLEQQQPTDDSESSLHSINSRSTSLSHNNSDIGDEHHIEDPSPRSRLNSEPLENEITAGIVGDGLEADESELPVDPFNDDSNGDHAPPLPNKRRLSAAQLQKIHEHLAASSSSLGPSSSSTSGCSSHGYVSSEQGGTSFHKQNSLHEIEGCDQSNGGHKDDKNSPAR